MFVARSAGRIRLARLAFVVAGLVPLAGLVAAAAHLRSTGHREAVRRDWQRAIGLPLAVGGIVHPRPGVIRAEGVVVAGSDGRPALSLPLIEVETAAGEVRLRVPAAACDAAAAGLLAGLAKEWLRRGARYDRDCVIEVAEFAWRVPAGRRSGEDGPSPGPGSPRPTLQPGSLRVECVSQAEVRAMRIVRSQTGGVPPFGTGEVPAGGRTASASDRDEVRIVRTTNAAAGPGSDGSPANHATSRTEIEATCGSGLPFTVLTTMMPDVPVSGWMLGSDAVVRGSLTALADGGRWRFAADGRVDGVDLQGLAASIGLRAQGVADVAVSSLEWRDGRLAACDLGIDAGPGSVERRFLESLVTTLGCRPGPAMAAAGARDADRFDAASFRLRLSTAGLEIVTGQRLGGPLAVRGGLPLVEPPGAVVSSDRLAWLLAPPGAGYAPATGPGAWLMSILPGGSGF